MTQASQDVRKDYDKYLAKATMLIHAPETTGAIQNMLGGGDPVKKIVAATVMIMQRLDGVARASGLEVQDTVKVFAASEIINMIAELGEAAGKFKKLSTRLHELALAAAVQDYVKGEIRAGRIDPKRLQAEMDANLRKLPADQRKEIADAQIRIQQTARQYNGGR